MDVLVIDVSHLNALDLRCVVHASWSFVRSLNAGYNIAIRTRAGAPFVQLYAEFR